MVGGVDNSPRSFPHCPLGDCPAAQAPWAARRKKAAEPQSFSWVPPSRSLSGLKAGTAWLGGARGQFSEILSPRPVPQYLTRPRPRTRLRRKPLESQVTFRIRGSRTSLSGGTAGGRGTMQWGGEEDLPKLHHAPPPAVCPDPHSAVSEGGDGSLIRLRLSLAKAVDFWPRPGVPCGPGRGGTALQCRTSSGT